MDRIRNVMLSRRGWVVVLTVLAVAGVVFRWHWLVALGLASIVLSVAPCLIATLMNKSELVRAR